MQHFGNILVTAAVTGLFFGEFVRASCCVCHSSRIPPALSSCYLQEVQFPLFPLLNQVLQTFGDVVKNPTGSWWSLSILWQENTPEPCVGTVVPKGLSPMGNALPALDTGQVSGWTPCTGSARTRPVQPRFPPRQGMVSSDRLAQARGCRAPALPTL